MSRESRNIILGWMFAGLVTVKLVYYLISVWSAREFWLEKHHLLIVVLGCACFGLIGSVYVLNLKRK
jgi:hypothetical protein